MNQESLGAPRLEGLRFENLFKPDDCGYVALIPVFRFRFCYVLWIAACYSSLQLTLQTLQEEKERKSECLPPEPHPDDPESVKIIFKMPNDSRVERRFHFTQSLTVRKGGGNHNLMSDKCFYMTDLQKCAPLSCHTKQAKTAVWKLWGSVKVWSKAQRCAYLFFYRDSDCSVLIWPRIVPNKLSYEEALIKELYLSFPHGHPVFILLYYSGSQGSEWVRHGISFHATSVLYHHLQIFGGIFRGW